MTQEGAGADLPIVRIFVSSPGDVAEERAVTLGVVRRLQGWLQGRLVLVPILWEQEPLLATAGFQQEIDRRAAPSSTDIALFVLWSRLGTPLSEDFVLEDGRRPTGTEWEFEEASSASHDGGVPHILVYRRRGPPPGGLEKGREDVLERLGQFESVERFFGGHFRHATDASFKGSYHRFKDASEFGQLLESHLTKLLTERLEGSAATITWHDTPFRGLETFEPEHARIFFGRTKALQEVRQALARQVEAGRAFVLMLGRSGNGKSSLARAGVLPLLDGPWVIEEGVTSGFCRRAVMHPGSHRTPLEALADALLAEDALPDLKDKGNAQELASLFEESPANCASDVKAALRRIEGKPPGRLVLLVDQMEELFTKEGVTDADRKAFAEVLDALARSGDVYVLATLRSDFYPAFSKLDVLMALKEGAGHYDLPPVDAAETAQIVRGPARVAGLSYEVDATRGQGLDDVLIGEAAKGPDLLPLLEYALTQLEERKTDHLLTFEAYEAMGGLEGAIAKRAENEWALLPEEARRAFPTVLRGLVEVGEGREGSATRRRAPLDEVATTPAAKTLVDRFVAARLLVAHGDGKQAVVTVAHEALLRTWPRMADRIQAEAELLRIRSRIRTQATLYAEKGRDRSLLLAAGKPLDEARLLGDAGFVLTEKEHTFVEASEAHARRVRRLKRGAVTAIAVLAIGALLLALFAFGKQREARRSADAARAERDAKQEALAENERQLAENERQLREIRRLSDAKQVRDLVLEADQLWPVHPDRAAAMKAWVERAEALEKHLPDHREALTLLRVRGEEVEPGAWRFDSDGDAWQHEVLESVIADLGKFGGEQGLVAAVRERHTAASTLAERSTKAHEMAWAETIEAVAASEKYGGLRLTPQVGLVPLGPDPTSHLHEFAHLGSGTIPKRNSASGALEFSEEGDDAIVLVLIPGGTFRMGAQKKDPDGLNYDKDAGNDESDSEWQPVAVTLSPYFLAKHECTQAQWKTLTGGRTPSSYKAGEVYRGKTLTLRNPVEQVSWEDCDRFLGRHQLVLPTEAQWEYACRAGTSTPWFPGTKAHVLNGYANIADSYCRANGGGADWSYTDEVDDGHTLHAPVGSFLANAFGLFDVHGNVWEWCRDVYGDYPDEAVTDPLVAQGPGNRVRRGGGWGRPAWNARAAARFREAPGSLYSGLGVRPGRPVTSE